MNIQTAIEDFITDRELNNFTVKTIRTYRQRLRYFSDWLQITHSVADTDDVQLNHLRSWVSYLQKTPTYRGKKMSDQSVHSYAQSLLAFFHWLEREEVIEKPITKRFKLPRVEKKFIPTFSSEDVKKLLEACEDGDENKPQLRKALTARNRAIVSTLLDTGIRLSELISLRLGDIDRSMRVLLVHRKGNKWQQVPITRDGFKSLHEYLTKHRAYLASLVGVDTHRKEDAVFLAADGKPLTQWGVNQLFRRLKRRTGIDGKRVSPHNCRRYMATTQLANGRSPLDVRRQLGHTTLTMTDHYASLDVQQLKKSHERHSPLRNENGSGGEAHGSGYWDE